MSARRRKQSKPKNTNEPTAEIKKGAASKWSRPVLSRRRKWLFGLTAAIVVPLLFFAVLEAGLRLGGYGYPTAFFIGPDDEGTYQTNNQFGLRFFPSTLARMPVPNSISTKSAGTIRIFVLGSSAAQGVPAPSFGFGRILEVMLQDRYPGVKFEVINAAMTAINSHVTMEIARDCATHQPDLFLVYQGNNEVVGPYGPGTVFQQWSPSLSLIRANIWVKSMRTGQLLGNAIDSFRSNNAPQTAWRGMEMFMGNPVAADDPRLAAVYDNFRRNLTDLCSIGRNAGAAVILSTVAVNLRDCPPLASQHRSDLSAEDLKKWTSIYQAGIEREAKEEWPDAITQYEEAARIDDRFADLQFRMGRCLAAADRLQDAREHFILARDLDVLRFRADSQINAAIREVAERQNASGVRLADAEKSLAASNLSAGGIPGGELFYEHVHLTFDGNFALAQAFMDQVEAALPQLAASRKQGPVLSRQQCAKALALTLWDESQLASQMTEMIARPPFTNQLYHAAQLESKRNWADALVQRASSLQTMREARGVYEAALKKTPDDWRLHQSFGNLALAGGDPESAVSHLLIALKKYPGEPTLYINLGNAEQRRDRLDKAIAYFQKALEIDPGSAMAHTNLAGALFRCGRNEEAVVHYRQSLEIDSGSAMAHYNYALALGYCKRLDEAIAEFEKVLEIDPQFVMAHFNLGAILADRGRTDEAAVHSRKALEIETGYASVHVNLGLALTDSGKIEEAIDQYQKALKIDPQYALAHYNLGVVLYDSGRNEESIPHFQKALEIDHRNANVYYYLGKALAAVGRTDEAIDHFQKALKIKPDFEEARQELEAAHDKQEKTERDAKDREKITGEGAGRKITRVIGLSFWDAVFGIKNIGVKTVLPSIVCSMLVGE